MSLDMYAENILDHYRNPKNFGKLENPDAKFKEFNPLCGDEYEFQLKFSDGVVEDVKFNGDGCAISMASASMLSEFAKGKKISEVKKISEEEIFRLLGVSISPARIKCALLPLSALKNCIANTSDV